MAGEKGMAEPVGLRLVTKGRGAEFDRFLILDAFLFVAVPAIVTLISYYTKSFWGDEILSISFAVRPGWETFAALAGDYHPPLYFLLLKLWVAFFGTGEFGLRCFQTVQGILLLWVSLKLFRKIFPDRRYHPFWLLLIVSSELWLFMPMLRYYTLAASLAMISTNLLWNWKKEPSFDNTLFLILSYIALLYTDYPTSVVIAFHFGYILFTKRSLAPLLFMSDVIAVVAFLPWMVITIGQIGGLRALGHAADLNASPFAMLVKCGYSAYAFLLGETVYPFESIAVIFAALLVGIVLVGAWRNSIFKGGQLWFHGGLAISGILFTSVITTYISTHTSFIYTPSRTFFGLGFLYAALGVFHDSLKTSRLKYLLIGIFAVVIGYGDYNLAMNRHFLMPVYATPWKEVLRDLRDEDGMIFADEGLCYDYYQNHLGGAYPVLQRFSSARDLSDKVTERLAEHPEGVSVYVIIQGRESTESEISLDLITYLQGNGSLEYEKKYLLLDESYRTIKSRILHRESYVAKVTLYKYVLKDFRKNRYPMG